jgi:hypothetical protein
MIKTLLILVILLVSYLTALSQSFDKYVGIRMGYTNGLFYEMEKDEMESYRFMFSRREGGSNFTAMKITRKYKLEELPKQVSLYYGYGGHVGFVKWDEKVTDPKYGYYWARRSSPVFGLDAIIGLSYDLVKQPISITFDVKPFFDVLGQDGFNAMPYDFAIGAVYCF